MPSPGVLYVFEDLHYVFAKTMKILNTIAAIAVFCFSLVIVLLVAALGGISHLRFDK